MNHRFRKPLSQSQTSGNCNRQQHLCRDAEGLEFGQAYHLIDPQLEQLCNVTTSEDVCHSRRQGYLVAVNFSCLDWIPFTSGLSSSIYQLYALIENIIRGNSAGSRSIRCLWKLLGHRFVGTNVLSHWEAR